MGRGGGPDKRRTSETPPQVANSLILGLAAEGHLERWTERSLIYRNELEEGFDERKVLHDWPATRQIASWAYAKYTRREDRCGSKPRSCGRCQTTGGGYYPRQPSLNFSKQ